MTAVTPAVERQTHFLAMFLCTVLIWLPCQERTSADIACYKRTHTQPTRYIIPHIIVTIIINTAAGTSIFTTVRVRLAGSVLMEGIEMRLCKENVFCMLIL